MLLKLINSLENVWYLLLPANLIYTTSVFIFWRFGSHGMDIDLVNYMLIAYIATFGILYGLLTVISYPQMPNKIFFPCNFFNLAVSLLINHFILRNIWLDLRWEYFFHPLNSTQNMIFIWLILLVWQCIIRCCVWIKNWINEV